MKELQKGLEVVALAALAYPESGYDELLMIAKWCLWSFILDDGKYIILRGFGCGFKLTVH